MMPWLQQAQTRSGPEHKNIGAAITGSVSEICSAVGILMRCSGKLPDRDALFRRQKHFVALLHVERGVKGGLIHRRAPRAETRRRMWIDGDQANGFLFPRLLAPGLGPARVKTLIAAETVDRRRFFTGQR